MTYVTLSPPLDARASATRARAPPRRARIVARVFSARRVATDASADEDANEDIERARTRCGGAECGARARDGDDARDRASRQGYRLQDLGLRATVLPNERMVVLPMGTSDTARPERKPNEEVF